jgi:hypothetical protein
VLKKIKKLIRIRNQAHNLTVKRESLHFKNELLDRF